MVDALALVAGLALAIAASVFAEMRWPVPKGSWRWAFSGPLMRKLISPTHPSWDREQYEYLVLVLGAYVPLVYAFGDWIGAYGLAAAFLLVTAARVGTHAALSSRGNVTNDDDAPA
jgi:hypothetical protein